MVYFGQLVIGPPGSGKTTYCCGMQMFLQTIGRTCEIVNLDFANDNVPYDLAIDVRELVSLERVMEEFNLGPNGGLIYCMEYLLEHFDWLVEKLAALESRYIIFDCPGQIELYTHHNCVHSLVERLQRPVPPATPDMECRLCTVHLVDSFYCSMPSTFVSSVLLVASAMLRLSLPQVSVLSKVDLLHSYGPLPFNLDFYTEMTNLMPLTKYVGRNVRNCEDDALEEDEEDNEDEVPGIPEKFRRMTEGLCEVLDEFGLISFIAMNIQDGETVRRVLAAIDKANGYSFAASEANEIMDRNKSDKAQNEGQEPINQMFRVAAQDLEPAYMRTLEIQERYGGRADVDDEPVPST